MSERREGGFWDAMEGRVPPPPAAATLGFKLLEIDPARGTIRVQFEGKREFLNPLGVVQGGFLAAMLDDTLGPALVCTLPPGHLTADLGIARKRAYARALAFWHGRHRYCGRCRVFFDEKGDPMP